MEKIKTFRQIILIMVCLISYTAKSAPPVYSGFSMTWAFCNASGGNMSAYEDVCLGGNINIINKSIYGSGNWPIPNTLVGSYQVWNDQGATSVLIATIPAASWPYNGVYTLPINSYFNYSSGLNFRVHYVGSDVTTSTPIGRYRSLYLTTRALPSVNAGADQSICLGASANLTASGASSYVWNPTGSTSPNIVVTPAVTTVYNVTGSITYNTPWSVNNTLTCAKTDAVTVNILPNPTVKGWLNNYSLCTNSPLPALNAYAGIGSFSYQWSYIPAGSNTSVSLPVTTSNINTSVYGYGYYTVIITNLTTGCMSSYSANVVLDASAAQNVNAQFALNDQPNFSSNILTITPTSTETGAHSWVVWSCDAAYTPTSQLTTAISASFTYNLPLNGYYKVAHSLSKKPCNEVKNASVFIHYDNSGKIVLTKEEPMTEDATAKKKSELSSALREFSMNVYPNPVMDNVTINVSGLQQNEDVILTVSDINGRVLISETKNTLGKFQVATNALESGLYFVTVKGNGITLVQKIVKE